MLPGTSFLRWRPEKRVVRILYIIILYVTYNTIFPCTAPRGSIPSQFTWDLWWGGLSPSTSDASIGFHSTNLCSCVHRTLSVLDTVPRRCMRRWAPAVSSGPRATPRHHEFALGPLRNSPEAGHWRTGHFCWFKDLVKHTDSNRLYERVSRNASGLAAMRVFGSRGSEQCKCVIHSRSSEADSRLIGQTPRLLWKPIIHYRVHNSPWPLSGAR